MIDLQTYQRVAASLPVLQRAGAEEAREFQRAASLARIPPGAGYTGRSGSLGAGLLLLAVIGSIISLGGLVGSSSVEAGWLAWMGGYLAMTLALAVFGIVAVRRRVFSRWNFAPILAGVGIPLLFGIGMVGVDSVSGQAPEWGAFLAVVLTSVGLILIGYRMQAEAGKIGEVAA